VEYSGKNIRLNADALANSVFGEYRSGLENNSAS
jgi:hypothetical protein